MRHSKYFVFGLIILLLVVTTAGCGLLEEPEEASEPISAIPLEETNDEAAEGGGETDTTESASEGTVFVIVPAESEARFLIGEILRGQATTAIGLTDQVGAEISIDFDNPGATQLGTVQVNARTIETDDSRRNRTINNFILHTNDYEFVTFEPTAITGLPDTITFGESYSFQITGALTIRGVTNAATFEATVTPVSETRLEGSATTTVNRGDYGLQIPSVPFVAQVDEEVVLEIDFVATPK